MKYHTFKKYLFTADILVPQSTEANALFVFKENVKLAFYSTGGGTASAHTPAGVTLARKWRVNNIRDAAGVLVIPTVEDPNLGRTYQVNEIEPLMTPFAFVDGVRYQLLPLSAG